MAQPESVFTLEAFIHDVYDAVLHTADRDASHGAFPELESLEDRTDAFFQEVEDFLDRLDRRQLTAELDNKAQLRAVGVKFLDYPMQLILPKRGEEIAAEEGHRLRQLGLVPFRRGKSCLFKGHVSDIEGRIAQSPIYFLYLDISTRRRPKLLGTAALKVSLFHSDRMSAAAASSGALSAAEALAAEAASAAGHAPRFSEIRTRAARDGYAMDSVSMYDALGQDVGSISAVARLMCYREGVVPHLRGAAEGAGGAGPDDSSRGGGRSDALAYLSRARDRRLRGARDAPYPPGAVPLDLSDTLVRAAEEEAMRVAGERRHGGPGMFELKGAPPSSAPPPPPSAPPPLTPDALLHLQAIAARRETQYDRPYAPALFWHNDGSEGGRNAMVVPGGRPGYPPMLFPPPMMSLPHYPGAFVASMMPPFPAAFPPGIGPQGGPIPWPMPYGWGGAEAGSMKDDSSEASLPAPTPARRPVTAAGRRGPAAVSAPRRPGTAAGTAAGLRTPAAKPKAKATSGAGGGGIPAMPSGGPWPYVMTVPVMVPSAAPPAAPALPAAVTVVGAGDAVSVMERAVEREGASIKRLLAEGLARELASMCQLQADIRVRPAGAALDILKEIAGGQRRRVRHRSVTPDTDEEGRRRRGGRTRGGGHRERSRRSRSASASSFDSRSRSRSQSDVTLSLSSSSVTDESDTERRRRRRGASRSRGGRRDKSRHRRRSSRHRHGGERGAGDGGGGGGGPGSASQLSKREKNRPAPLLLIEKLPPDLRRAAEALAVLQERQRLQKDLDREARKRGMAAAAQAAAAAPRPPQMGQRDPTFADLGSLGGASREPSLKAPRPGPGPSEAQRRAREEEEDPEPLMPEASLSPVGSGAAMGKGGRPKVKRQPSKTRMIEVQAASPTASIRDSIESPVPEDIISPGLKLVPEMPSMDSPRPLSPYGALGAARSDMSLPSPAASQATSGRKKTNRPPVSPRSVATSASLGQTQPSLSDMYDEDFEEEISVEPFAGPSPRRSSGQRLSSGLAAIDSNASSVLEAWSPGVPSSRGLQAHASLGGRGAPPPLPQPVSTDDSISSDSDMPSDVAEEDTAAAVAGSRGYYAQPGLGGTLGSTAGGRSSLQEVPSMAAAVAAGGSSEESEDDYETDTFDDTADPLGSTIRASGAGGSPFRASSFLGYFGPNDPAGGQGRFSVDGGAGTGPSGRPASGTAAAISKRPSFMVPAVAGGAGTASSSAAGAGPSSANSSGVMIGPGSLNTSRISYGGAPPATAPAATGAPGLMTPAMASGPGSQGVGGVTRRPLGPNFSFTMPNSAATAAASAPLAGGPVARTPLTTGPLGSSTSFRYPAASSTPSGFVQPQSEQPSSSFVTPNRYSMPGSGGLAGTTTATGAAQVTRAATFTVPRTNYGGPGGTLAPYSGGAGHGGATGTPAPAGTGFMMPSGGRPSASASARTLNVQGGPGGSTQLGSGAGSVTRSVR